MDGRLILCRNVQTENTSCKEHESTFQKSFHIFLSQKSKYFSDPKVWGISNVRQLKMPAILSSRNANIVKKDERCILIVINLCGIKIFLRLKWYKQILEKNLDEN